MGRVTFEGLDSIRCCRGEASPYDKVRHDPADSQYPWVYEVDNSAWLQERHEYEFHHYDTSLLEEYIHYFFQFHDEFVEVIAKGIWFEKMKYDQVDKETPDHPLMVNGYFQSYVAPLPPHQRAKPARIGDPGLGLGLLCQHFPSASALGYLISPLRGC